MRRYLSSPPGSCSRSASSWSARPSSPCSALISICILAARRHDHQGHSPARAAARVQPRRQAHRAVRRGAAHPAHVRRDPEPDDQRGARCRGRQLLSARRRRLPGPGPCDRAPPVVGRKSRRRQHDHDAARARPVPEPGEELSPQAHRDLHDVPHRAGADQAGNPRAVLEQDVSRPARVRRRRGSGGLLRQDRRSS